MAKLLKGQEARFKLFNAPPGKQGKSIININFAFSEKSNTFAFLTRRSILHVPLSVLKTGYRKAHQPGWRNR